MEEFMMFFSVILVAFGVIQIIDFTHYVHRNKVAIETIIDMIEMTIDI